VRKLFITLSALSLVLGFAVAILIFVLGLISGFDNDKYGKVPLPGEGRVTLPEGEVTVFYEERGSYPDGLASYTVLSADTRRPVPSRPSGSASYEISNVNGTSVDKLTVPAEGEYLVRGRTQSTTAFNQPALTFGPGIKFGTIAVRSLAAIGIGLLLCVLFAVLARAFKRRPTAATVPPPHSSAPMAAWQMPQPPPPPAAADPQQELAQLEDDRRMGRISEADYQARRKQILDRI
jgi:hypothetical protein